MKGFGFRLFRKKSADLTILQSAQFPGLKNHLNELKKNKEEITIALTRKQAVKRAGEKWKRLQDKFTALDNHLRELSVKLEERHQKMTLLMRPIDDEADLEWKEILNDYRKTRSERDLRMAELDNHIALSGYIIEGSPEEACSAKSQ